jgi:hypothetical protein
MKAKSPRKLQTYKTNYMSDGAFADLKDALEGALAFERGGRRHLKVTRIQAPRRPNAETTYHRRRVVSRKVSPNPGRPHGPQM